MIPEPNAQELDRHRRAVEKLSRHLFAKYTLADLHIVGEVEIVTPSVSIVSHGVEALETTTVIRTVHLGGLCFVVDRGEQTHDHNVTIKHERDDRFDIAILSNRLTEVATTERFKTLPERVYNLIQAVRRSKIQPRTTARMG